MPEPVRLDGVFLYPEAMDMVERAAKCRGLSLDAYCGMVLVRGAAADLKNWNGRTDSGNVDAYNAKRKYVTEA